MFWNQETETEAQYQVPDDVFDLVFKVRGASLDIDHAFARGVKMSQTGELVAVGSRSLDRAQRFGANFGIPQFFGVEIPPDACAIEQLCDTDDLESLKAGAVEALRASFVHARNAIAAVPDADLDEATKLFGRDTTKRAAMLLYVTHMHEHLGQSVAYARSNGVVPPWSAGG